MKRFHEMTADELAAYDGPVFTARCQIVHRVTGTVVPYDFQEPSRELRDTAVDAARHRYGTLVSRTDYNPNPTEPTT